MIKFLANEIEQNIEKSIWIIKNYGSASNKFDSKIPVYLYDLSTLFILLEQR